MVLLLAAAGAAGYMAWAGRETTLSPSSGGVPLLDQASTLQLETEAVAAAPADAAALSDASSAEVADGQHGPGTPPEELSANEPSALIPPPSAAHLQLEHEQRQLWQGEQEAEAEPLRRAEEQQRELEHRLAEQVAAYQQQLGTLSQRLSAEEAAAAALSQQLGAEQAAAAALSQQLSTAEAALHALRGDHAALQQFAAELQVAAAAPPPAPEPSSTALERLSGPQGTCPNEAAPPVMGAWPELYVLYSAGTLALLALGAAWRAHVRHATTAAAAAARVAALAGAERSGSEATKRLAAERQKAEERARKVGAAALDGVAPALLHSQAHNSIWLRKCWFRRACLPAACLACNHAGFLRPRPAAFFFPAGGRAAEGAGRSQGTGRQPC